MCNLPAALSTTDHPSSLQHSWSSVSGVQLSLLSLALTYSESHAGTFSPPTVVSESTSHCSLDLLSFLAVATLLVLYSDSCLLSLLVLLKQYIIDRWLKQQTLISLEAGKFKIRVPADCFLVRALFVHSHIEEKGTEKSSNC